MSDRDLDRLRAEASRGDYASMARLARALHASGRSPRQVIRDCYGVEFPGEFFAVADAPPAALYLPGDFANQPWKLAIPLERGGPPEEPDFMDEIERAIVARDPDLVPLLLLVEVDAQHGDLVLCYRLAELAAGRTVIEGLPQLDPDGEVVRCGDSLLAVLREHLADIHRMLEYQRSRPANRGAGAIEQDEVDRAWSLVERIDQLAGRVRAG